MEVLDGGGSRGRVGLGAGRLDLPSCRDETVATVLASLWNCLPLTWKQMFHLFPEVRAGSLTWLAGVLSAGPLAQVT